MNVLEGINHFFGIILYFEIGYGQFHGYIFHFIVEHFFILY